MLQSKIDGIIECCEKIAAETVVIIGIHKSLEINRQAHHIDSHTCHIGKVVVGVGIVAEIFAIFMVEPIR